LRHKSWNVWRKDNIDRVERDEKEHLERIAKEKAQAADEVEGGSDDEVEDTVKLSAPPPPSSSSSTTASNHRKSKRARTAAEGVPLAGVAAEAMGNARFYMKLRPAGEDRDSDMYFVRGRYVHGTEAAAARDRDAQRKRESDPTRSFLRAADSAAVEGGEVQRGRAEHSHDADPESVGDGIPPLDLATVDWEALRSRRLRREAKERRRAARLFRR